MSSDDLNQNWHPRAALSAALSVFVALGVCSSALTFAAEVAAGASLDPAGRAERILVQRCLECHGTGREGGLDLRTRVAALKGGDSGASAVPGKPGESLLLQRVEAGEMPPKGSLAKEEIAALREWIEKGFEYPDRALDPFAFTTSHRAGYDWWSLQPVARPAVPATRTADRIRTPIDRFVLARLEAAGLGFSAEASRADLIRRVTYDLTGMIPTFDEVAAFEADARSDAYKRLVERLLASPQYGERWGRHWLDLVRFAESNGFERDRIRTGFWPYRDYVIRAFNRNVSYERFLIEQIAGDALPGADPDAIIATGFLVAGPKNDVGTISPLEQMRTRQDELEEVVSATSTALLGITVGCARCHDHKFDPVPTRDYYALTAVFSGLDRGDRPVANPEEQRRYDDAVAAVDGKIAEVEKRLAVLREEGRRLAAADKAGNTLLPPVRFTENVEQFEPVRARFVRLVIERTSDGASPCVDEIEVYAAGSEKNVALASAGAKASASSLLPGYPIHQIPHLNNGKLGNAQSWISNEPGAGTATIELVEPIDVARIVWGRDREGKYRDRLAVAYRIEVSIDGTSWKRTADSSRRRPFGAGDQATDETLRVLLKDDHPEFAELLAKRASLDAARKAVPPLPTSYAARDGAPQKTHVLHRGDVRSPTDPVGPAALSAVRSLNPALTPTSSDSGPERRLQLARWIVDPKNPLTARVWVNRVWQHHFGQGIVNTPSDFGYNGDRPSHPELLDWLADEFVRGGWDTKQLHRLMVLSSAYRQASDDAAAGSAIDAANRLLWRANPRRLTSESLRDAILQTAGNLDQRMGGPGYRVFEYRDGNVPDYVLLERAGPETWRRGVYRFNIRTFETPLMAAFDCPDPSVSTPVRTASVTALQALSLMNNQFVFEQSQQLAERIAAARAGQAEQVVEAYRRTLRRDPTPDEQALAAGFVERHGLMSLCRVLVNTNEFLTVR